MLTFAYCSRKSVAAVVVVGYEIDPDLVAAALFEVDCKDFDLFGKRQLIHFD